MLRTLPRRLPWPAAAARPAFLHHVQPTVKINTYCTSAWTKVGLAGCVSVHKPGTYMAAATLCSTRSRSDVEHGPLRSSTHRCRFTMGENGIKLCNRRALMCSAAAATAALPWSCLGLGNAAQKQAALGAQLFLQLCLESILLSSMGMRPCLLSSPPQQRHTCVGSMDCGPCLQGDAKMHNSHIHAVFSPSCIPPCVGSMGCGPCLQGDAKMNSSHIHYTHTTEAKRPSISLWRLPKALL